MIRGSDRGKHLPFARAGPAWCTWLRHFRECLGWRLVALLALSLLVLLGASSVLTLRLHRQQLQAQLEERAIEMGETVLSATRFAMLQNDRRHLESILGDVAASDRVLVLRLLGSQGDVSISSRAGEVGQRLGLDAPQCAPCHGGPSVLVPLSVRDGLHLYGKDGEQTALSLVVPVLNEEACSTAACHVHAPTEVLLGLLDIELNAGPLEAAIARDRGRMLGLHAGTLLAICAVVGWLAWRLVHRPFQEIVQGAELLGNGALQTRLREDRIGELGQVAVSFNAMASRLEQAHQESRDWNRKLEARVAQKSRELERARDSMVFTEKMVSLGRLASIVAHEINNPLAGVLVSAKLLRRRLRESGDGTAQGDRFDETLAMIERETARCGDIVRNLLLFSRSRELSMTEEQIATIVERSIRLVKHQAELQGVQVDVQVEKDLPPIRCDGNQIEQALLALVINALDAMPEGGRLIVMAERANSKTLRVSVVDNGMGIAEDIRMKIFEPFFTTKSEGQGSGLCLSVMYGIVQRHGGRVRVDSTVGAGTTMTIELPFDPEANGAMPGCLEEEP